MSPCSEFCMISALRCWCSIIQKLPPLYSHTNHFEPSACDVNLIRTCPCAVFYTWQPQDKKVIMSKQSLRVLTILPTWTQDVSVHKVMSPGSISFAVSFALDLKNELGSMRHSIIRPMLTTSHVIGRGRRLLSCQLGNGNAWAIHAGVSH